VRARAGLDEQGNRQLLPGPGGQRRLASGQRLRLQARCRIEAEAATRGAVSCAVATDGGCRINSEDEVRRSGWGLTCA
jgi:hypothetical protein